MPVIRSVCISSRAAAAQLRRAVALHESNVLPVSPQQIHEDIVIIVTNLNIAPLCLICDGHL